METSIRSATSDDIDDLCELFDEIDALHRDHLPGIFQRPNGLARERDYLLGVMADDNVALLVAEEAENLIGVVHAIVRDAAAIPVFLPRRYVIVDSIVVRSGFQNRGIGRKLMDRVEGWATARGATSIELNVYEFNETAISFYEGLGYQTLSRKMSKKLKKEKARS